MPEDLLGSQSTPDIQPAPQAVSQATPETPPEASVSNETPQAAPQQASQQQMVDMLEYLRQQTGGQLPQNWQTSEQALRDMMAVYQRAPQLQQLARYGQEYQQHYQEFQEYLRQKGGQQAQQAQADRQQGWWNPPMADEEARRLYAQWFQQGPDGRMVRRPDCPPSVEQKLTEYAAYLDSWQSKLATNPQEALREPVQQIVQQQVQQALQQYNAQLEAQAVIQANAGWMFLKGPDGQPQVGNYSPAGLAYWQFVQQARQLGISNTQGQDRYAREQMELAQYRNYVSAQQAAQQQALQQQQAAQEQAAQRAASQVRHAPSETPSDGPAAGPRSLRNRLVQDLASNGFSVGQG